MGNSSSLNPETKEFDRLLNKPKTTTTTKTDEGSPPPTTTTTTIFDFAQKHYDKLQLFSPSEAVKSNGCVLASLLDRALGLGCPDEKDPGSFARVPVGSADFTTFTPRQDDLIKTWHFTLDKLLQNEKAKVLPDSSSGGENQKNETSVFHPFKTPLLTTLMTSNGDTVHNSQSTLIEFVVDQYIFSIREKYDEKETLLRNRSLFHDTIKKLVLFTVEDLKDEHYFKLPFMLKNRFNKGVFLHFCYEMFENDLELFIMLLNLVNFDHSVVNENGETILHAICRYDDPDSCPFLQEFLSSGQASLQNQEWMYNQTYENLEETDKKKFDQCIEIIGRDGKTPLAIAICRSAVGIVKDLVSFGVGGSFLSYNVKKRPSANPFQIAVNFSDIRNALDARNQRPDLSEEERVKREEIIGILMSLPHAHDAMLWSYNSDHRDRTSVSGYACPIETAAKVGYVGILRVFLKNVKLTKEELQNIYCMPLSDTVKKMLDEYRGVSGDS